MIFRVVLRGRLGGALPLGRFSGLAARGAVLRWLADGADAEVVARLHDERRPKGLTVGPLYIDGSLARWPAVYREGLAVEFHMGAVGRVFELIRRAFERGVPVVLEGVRVDLEELEFARFVPGGSAPGVFAVWFLTPTRFARAPAMRRRRAVYDLFPSGRVMAAAAAIHARSVLDASGQVEAFGVELSLSVLARLVKWAYTYVFPRYVRLRSEVVYVKGNPQVGVVGCVQYEIASRSKTRDLFWRLMQFAEVMGLGNGKSYGLGHIRLAESCSGGEK